MSAYTILPRLVLRTPLFSFSGYAAATVSEIIRDALFQKALYLASPSFYDQLSEKNFDTALLNPKEILTIRKYYNRMCFRPTPFGLFSAVTAVSWGEPGPVVVASPGETIVHIAADQELVKKLSVRFGEYLAGGQYRLNPTVYKVGSEYRFIQTELPAAGTVLNFALHQFEANAFTRTLTRQLQKAPMNGEQLIRFIMTHVPCSPNDALTYLDFLKTAQIILPLGDASIIGEDQMSRLTTMLPPRLENIRSVLERLTGRDVVVSPVNNLFWLRRQSNRIARHTGIQLSHKVYYANSQRPLISGAIDSSYQNQLAEALEALQKLAQPPGDGHLRRFAEDFRKRFEDRKIPLMKAIDPDAGVGYGDLAQQNVKPALLEDLVVQGGGPAQEPIPWSAAHRLLMAKWNNCAPGGVIRLSAADLSGMPAAGPGAMPPGLAIMFRLNDQQLCIENAGGVSGTSLIGRFTLIDPIIHQLARDAAAAESENNPEVIFADIGQLSDVHADNINRRLHIYDYEIPVNCASMLPGNRQIQLSDLYISVVKGEVILESMSLRKRVIPRLSTAYNYAHNRLAVFRFLCDLQYQSLRANLNFDLESYFPGMNSYPRVEYGGTILGAAKWRLNEENIRDFCRFCGSDLVSGILSLRESLNLPQWVSLNHYDQKLYFDLGDPQQGAFFFNCISRMKTAAIEEFPAPAGHSLVMSAEGKPLISQFIAIAVNKQATYAGSAVTPISHGSYRRAFAPGTQWLYLKLYCTPAAGNELLVNKILPLIRKIMRTKGTSWFFIRYADPKHHIRLRVKVSEEQVGEVLRLFKDQFAELIDRDIIHAYQADTYFRELERYSADLIEDAENFFRASSDLNLYFLGNSPRKKDKYDSYHLAISTMATILHQMSPLLTERINFLSAISESFFAEFGGHKPLKVELDGLYRKLRADMAALDKQDDLFRDLGLVTHRRQFEISIRRVVEKSAQMGQSRRTALFADLIHMHLNRVFDIKQRQQEMALYYCFYKYNLSLAAIQKQSAGRVPAALDQ